jgi:hypothetical protein
MHYPRGGQELNNRAPPGCGKAAPGDDKKSKKAIMNEWLRLVLQPNVVRRALKFACIVGIILISINHGYAILHHQLTRGRILQMCLTVLVPYTVSTLSSIGAMREMQRRKIIDPAPAPR